MTKNFILLSVFSVLLFGCSKNNTPPKIIGEWELYKFERQTLSLDSIDATTLDLYQSVVWSDLTPSQEPEPSLKFNDDNTFEQFYAGVLTHEGIWTEIDENSFSFTFNQDPWSILPSNYVVQFHCDNTISIEYLVEAPAGNHDFQDSDWYVIGYYRSPGSVECDAQIEYYVE